MNNPPTFTNKSLHSKAIVSLDGGAKIGNVEDILIDPQGLRFVALLIKGEKGESVLPKENIKMIGDDAVTIESVSATQSSAHSFPGTRPFSAFRGYKVVNSSGSLVGELHDIEIEPTSGAFVSLDVRSGGVLGIGTHRHHISANDICSFGPDLITIQATVTEAPVA